MFGKIIDDVLILAPHYLEINGKQILNPQESDYFEARYKKIIYEKRPEIGFNEHLIENYSESKDKIYVSYLIENNTTTTTLSREAEIMQRFSELDRISIRPMRAGETERLKEIEAEAQILREELKELKINL